MKRTKKCGFEDGFGRLEKTLLRIDGNLVFLHFIRQQSDWIVKTPRESSAATDQFRKELHDFFDTTLSGHVKTRQKTPLEEYAKAFGPELSMLKRKSLGDLTLKKIN